MPTEIRTDCLIIGSGIAGLSAAIALADKGLSTVIISCAKELEEGNTLHAQGGIIFEQSSGRLFEDIMEAGCYANYPPAVKQLTDLGPSLVKSILIDRVGVCFDKDVNGLFHLTREAAHSESRIIHRGDESGRAIEQKLVRYCQGLSSITFINQTTAVNLLMTSFHCKDRARLHEEARCFGAFVYDQKLSTVYPIFANQTVLATGGIGQLFLHNTNSTYSRGDGIALGYRAGLRLSNLEYIQFHPTTFYHPSSRRFLISEALRGEGAILLNNAGHRFCGQYLPQFKVPELAPRDKVARAIHQEMLSQGSHCVYLDISHKPSEWIKERFPFVYQNCLSFNVDITKEPIPVVPGAHYHCGGIWTDLNGQTTVGDLFAVGEVACTGVHGANRLASTSLLEALVWGARAGMTIADRLANGQSEFPEIEPWSGGQVEVDPAFLAQDWMTLKHTMWNYVGLIKTDARLQRAEGVLRELSRGIEVFYRKAVLSDGLIGLRHASLVALLILKACKRNSKSLGCYLREELEI